MRRAGSRTDDLAWMEHALRAGEMTEPDQLRFTETEAAATRRMLDGWPAWDVAPSATIEGDRD